MLIVCNYTKYLTFIKCILLLSKILERIFLLLGLLFISKTTVKL